MSPTLSIIIIAVNEASNIEACIRSCAFADEVLMVDSGSTDNTAFIAQSLGAKVLQTNWPGYGPQQNRGIDASIGDWIFSLDADERITPDLAAEIQDAIQAATFNVFDVPRSSLYVSRFMRHSGWTPDRTRRLCKRGTARFTEHEIHANLSTTYPVGHLSYPIIHYSYYDFYSVIEKMNRYSSGGARDMYAMGKRGSLSKAITHGLWAFIRTYFLRLGFLDGREGFMLAISNTEVTYYRYIKLYYLEKNQLAQNYLAQNAIQNAHTANKNSGQGQH